ncbi:hypothetical protein C8R44DRAFT_753741 [Mycena epipterygia]|nr:hypothetical protein C8R44DRAFT_753741 [Mycena epipterygia]
MVVSHIFLTMLQDIFHIIPPFLLWRFKKTPPKQPISSATLPHQAAALLFTTVCFTIASAFHTDFVFTRSGTLAVRQGERSTVQATLDRLGIALRYRDVHYIRVSAVLPWPAIFFALGANIVTLYAWCEFRRTPPPPPTVEDGISDSAEVEKPPEVRDDGTKGEKGGVAMVLPV